MMASHTIAKKRSKSRARDREKRRRRGHRHEQIKWLVRRYRVGTLSGPAWVEFTFPTEGGGVSRLCVQQSELLDKELLKKLANLVPIFPDDVTLEDAGQVIQFIRGLVSSSTKFELVPIRTGFVDANTFVTHGEVIYLNGTRVPRPRLGDSAGQPIVDLRGTSDGAHKDVLRVARYSTFLAFFIGVGLAACLPSYLKLRRKEGEEITPLISETAVFNLSGKSSSGKSSAGLAAISLAGSSSRAGSMDVSHRGLAELASNSNDLAFLIDDTEKIEGGPGAFVKTLKGVVHVVPGGKSKIISSGVDQQKFPQLQWTAFGLTSSPKPIKELAGEKRWTISPGDKARLFDIPVPGPDKGGIFDRISGGRTKRASESIKLIARLHRGYENHCGHTMPQWVQYLMRKNRSVVTRRLVAEFVAHVKTPKQGWETRFATKFGVVYAAMRMACDARILPWEKSFPLDVATKCYRRARRAARTSEEYASRAPSKILRLMKDSRHVERYDNKPIELTDGILAISYKKNRRSKLGVLDHAMISIVGSKTAKKIFANAMREAGVLAPGHGHAGTREEHINTVRNGERNDRTRLWVFDAKRLKRYVACNTA